MLNNLGRLVSFVTILWLLSSAAVADTVVGSGTFQSGWSPSDSGGTYFSNLSWDGAQMNIGFCMAGGGLCSYAGQPDTALPVFAGTNFSAPGAFYISPGSSSSAALTLEIAGLAGSNQFGWYLVGTDPTNAANRHPLFLGPQGAGSTASFDPSGNYGLYILAGGTTLYTSTLFGGTSDQHFVIFQQGSTFWIGVEDLPLGSGDRDYNDMLVRICPVPEPSSLALLGTGLAGLATLVRRKFARA